MKNTDLLRTIAAFLLLGLFSISCEDSDGTKNEEENQEKKLEEMQDGDVVASALTDVDGNTYSAVKIGTQIWMAENLAVSAANLADGVDGDIAAQDCDMENVYVWSNTDDKYGKLYSWEAAKLACPTGWHLPSIAEWDTLVCFTIAEKMNGHSEEEKLNSLIGVSEGGSDTYNFTARYGGLCEKDGSLLNQGMSTYWWTSDFISEPNYFDAGLSGIVKQDGTLHWEYGGYGTDPNRGVSVRCLKDK